MTMLLAGLAFGIVGSGHCAAMCGPLVLLANPRPVGLAGASATPPSRLAVHAALYHAGRLLTYLALGALAGLAGSGLARLGLGRVLALGAGIALLLQALVGLRIVSARLSSASRAPALRWPGGLASGVTRALGRAGTWMRAHRVQGPVVFGALNGLLPCGLLYAALTASAGFGDFGQALLFMGAFAVGTTPVLVLVALAGSALTSRVPLAVRRAAPVALAIVALLLIMRGVRAPHESHGQPGADHARVPAGTVAHGSAHTH